MHTNDYEAGSLLWIERNQALAYRRLLQALIAGRLSTGAAQDSLDCMDSDTVR